MDSCFRRNDGGKLSVNTVETLEQTTMHRVTWRLVPIVMLGYFCAALDRANVGMAATTMSPALHFSNMQYGFGAGVFYLGYLLLEVPSNLILARVGARIWLARILVTWGLISGLTAFVWNDWSFYGARFVLGLAEAGYFPGVLIFLTWWFPARYRGRMVGWFMSAGVFSQILGPPIGGELMRLDGLFGLAGWQWLFIVEALPSMLTGVLVLCLLRDRPGDATWLRPEQRTWLEDRLVAERAQQEAVRKYSLWQALASPQLWLLTFVQFGHQFANSVVFFMPLIVKGLGVPKDLIGTVAAIPYLFGFIGMVSWGYKSDRAGERVWHAALPKFLVTGALGAAIFVGADHPVLLMVLLCLAVIGNQSFAPTFWAIPGTMLTGTAAAGGIALINALGNLGNWAGPTAYGAMLDATHSTNLALLCLAIGPLAAAITLVLVGHDRRLEQIPATGRRQAKPAGGA
jgi:MFS transporter, ACS family, tartrate transporter